MIFWEFFAHGGLGPSAYDAYQAQERTTRREKAQALLVRTIVEDFTIFPGEVTSARIDYELATLQRDEAIAQSEPGALDDAERNLQDAQHLNQFFQNLSSIKMTNR